MNEREKKRVILETLLICGFVSIARDEYGDLYVYFSKPEDICKEHDDGNGFWDDGEIPYDISQLEAKFGISFDCRWSDDEPKLIADMLEEYDVIAPDAVGHAGNSCAHSDVVELMEHELRQVIDLFKRKNRSYGGEDVFHNFRQTAKRELGDDSIENMFKIAEIYKDKHNVALAKGATVAECEERLRDNIVYSLLQLAMLKEHRDGHKS